MKILIIEDEIGIVQFLQQGLQEEGYQITTAKDGLEGLKILEKQSFDLILLDWMLPIITGLDVCKTIRTNDLKIPIIFLTAKDTVQETIEGLQAGANDYIKKPFSFEELLARIKVQLRKPENDKILHLGSIMIDVAQHKVFVNQKEIAFTHREFDLLHFLVKNKGNVCTRTQIIEEVWQIYFEYDTGVIDVFMNSIRKKLNLKLDENLIKTIRGVGYIANEISNNE